MRADQRRHDDSERPLVYFLDELETFMHPRAQDRLLDDLDETSKTSQVFVTTRSPYLLRSYEPRRHKLIAFFRNARHEVVVDYGDGDLLGLFPEGRPFGPSWGAINYVAFGVASIEFHNELFGKLQEVTGASGIKAFDQWLLDNGERVTGVGVALADDQHLNCLHD